MSFQQNHTNCRACGEPLATDGRCENEDCSLWTEEERDGAPERSEDVTRPFETNEDRYRRSRK
jgi:hypothetical protein